MQSEAHATMKTAPKMAWAPRKVLILGGYGVFGSRLARLLVRDGHHVTVAGRDQAQAARLAHELGCAARVMDRAGDLTGLEVFEVAVDAAGPFHLYGADPYRLAHAAVAAGVHYLDLCDDAAFCAGIGTLNETAQAAGVCVVSGLSSVPALSSAAVDALAQGDAPQRIETAILPGNRAPRGMSVMQSILSQAGQPMRVWQAGKWVPAYGWSDPVDYALPDGVTRQGWVIDVPDLHLFPQRYGAETVMFRAGLELAVMRYGLAAFALLRQVLPFTVSRGWVRVFKWIAELLTPFGTGRGGMIVMVDIAEERRIWRLWAEDGDGPFVPAGAARALLRRSEMTPGAGPALGLITLAEAESAMDDLRIRFDRQTAQIA